MKRYFCNSLRSCLSRQRLEIARFRKGAGLAEGTIACNNLAVVVDALPALVAGDARGLVAGYLARLQWNRDPLRREELVVGKFAVGEHLLRILPLDVRIHLASPLLRRLQRGDPHGAASGDCFEPKRFVFRSTQVQK